MTDDGQDHRECSHDDPNRVMVCPSCLNYSLLVRVLTQLKRGDVAAYDPLCGVTVHQ